MKHSLKKTLRPTFSLSILSVSILSLNAYAISLDEAVTRQLSGAGLGTLACHELLTAGGNPVGDLGDICVRAYPAGTVSNSAGGGSATPVTSQGLLSDSEGQSGQLKDGIEGGSGKWSVFFTAEGGSIDRKVGETEGAFDSSLNHFVLGASVAPTNKVALSIALDVSAQEGDFANGGDFSVNSTGVRLLGSYQPVEAAVIQVAYLYSNVESERLRTAELVDVLAESVQYNFSGSPFAENSYTHSGLSAQVSYALGSGAFSFSPLLGVDWGSSDFGTYSETGGSGFDLTFYDDVQESMQALIGFQTSYALGFSGGAFIPQLSMILRNEFESDAREVNVSFVEDANSVQFAYQTDALDDQFVDVSAGGVFVLKNGAQIFVNVQKMLSHDVYDSFIANAGFRLEL